jgi:hypothetical protein
MTKHTKTIPVTVEIGGGAAGRNRRHLERMKEQRRQTIAQAEIQQATKNRKALAAVFQALKRGRPKTARGTGGSRLEVRLSKDERASLDADARRLGCTTAELVRARACRPVVE